LELRKKYKVFLLSNTNPAVMEWARTIDFSSKGLPIMAYFDKVYASYEIGMTKPDPAIFLYMIEDTGMYPDETVFVDDGERNIATAASLGMATLRPENGADWRDELDVILHS
jgi:putative hydrolase of the HAD superfamily